jgi:hypothetical protein
MFFHVIHDREAEGCGFISLIAGYEERTTSFFFALEYEWPDHPARYLPIRAAHHRRFLQVQAITISSQRFRRVPFRITLSNLLAPHRWH